MGVKGVNGKGYGGDGVVMGLNGNQWGYWWGCGVEWGQRSRGQRSEDIGVRRAGGGQGSMGVKGKGYRGQGW